MTQRLPGNKETIVIIGGGASGLAAACVLAEHHLPFILLEKEEKPGRKLLATGNGRCNLMNTGAPVYFGEEGFAKAVLAACGHNEVGAFFHGLGLTVFEEELGRVYPLTRQAASVADCLLAAIHRFPGARLLAGQEAASLTVSREGFVIKTAQGMRLSASAVLVCGGSPAAPKLGGSEGPARLLAGLGHSLLPFFPALSALETDIRPLKGLSGQRFMARLGLLSGGRLMGASRGELLAADYGVSGLCAMQLARVARESLAHGLETTLSIDFSPLLGLAPPLMGRLAPGEFSPGENRGAILQMLKERQARLGAERLYTGLLPLKLAEKMKGLALEQAALALADTSLRVSGVKGFDQAQVASGGIACRDFNPLTMESMLHPGLFAAGEVLNVDGDTGGFNLLFAWAGGILAAREIARRFGKD